VGVPGREWTGMVIPYGMVPVPAGTFHMGQADEDVAATQINFNKQVTIGAFFMDDSEITNNEYRQFMDAIMMDSLSILGEDFVMNELYPDSTVWVKDLRTIWEIRYLFITGHILHLTISLLLVLTGKRQNISPGGELHTSMTSEQVLENGQCQTSDYLMKLNGNTLHGEEEIWLNIHGATLHKKCQRMYAGQL
jgi:hypothetical protein